ncbi:chemotaxis protein CheW [Candidatus Endoriftia persephone]|jgi:purine-binding chemotaxis protein CheW|uniref:Chemotaxis protein CheW n=3 Tax=Gammaproteobacteria TaxID=1236 RepID=G2FB18_9GAMM|nr:chemotaxis protein CheW [Candidatus Endoriftia persephone]EGV52829.1 chemotaxis protein CheW [endosymbiont of Riftia pachyptila (vent Ph05)]EGW55956.1 chemotaxis protein CheW [endosymbiont of Tevnia jerichonana (vent Tica)]USF88089.1 chemotaxis protein CheW [Candidatus Endoriftia persephone]
MNTAKKLEPVELEMTGQEYLTFSLGSEDYGVDILRVQEIRGWELVTRIPNAPDYVKGVLNLRGSIVPIFDLRQRLGLEPQDYSKDTVVIVVRVNGANNSRAMGMVVDAVSDVLNANPNTIRNTPEFGEAIATEFISGLADAEGRMIMLLDIDQLFSQRREQEQESVVNA